jgi:hypothetical protein
MSLLVKPDGTPFEDHDAHRKRVLAKNLEVGNVMLWDKNKKTTVTKIEHMVQVIFVSPEDGELEYVMSPPEEEADVERVIEVKEVPIYDA